MHSLAATEVFKRLSCKIASAIAFDLNLHRAKFDVQIANKCWNYFGISALATMKGDELFACYGSRNVFFLGMFSPLKFNSFIFSEAKTAGVSSSAHNKFIGLITSSCELEKRFLLLFRAGLAQISPNSQFKSSNVSDIFLTVTVLDVPSRYIVG